MEPKLSKKEGFKRNGEREDLENGLPTCIGTSILRNSSKIQSEKSKIEKLLCTDTVHSVCFEAHTSTKRKQLPDTKATSLVLLDSHTKKQYDLKNTVG